SRRIVCQYCEKPGHSAKVCYKLRGYPPGRNQTPTAHNTRAMPPGVSD
ncbi:hypothetical protein L195_g064495, partial [Trifolium pratense]